MAIGMERPCNDGWKPTIVGIIVGVLCVVTRLSVLLVLGGYLFVAR